MRAVGGFLFFCLFLGSWSALSAPQAEERQLGESRTVYMSLPIPNLPGEEEQMALAELHVTAVEDPLVKNPGLADLPFGGKIDDQRTLTDPFHFNPVDFPWVIRFQAALDLAQNRLKIKELLRAFDVTDRDLGIPAGFFRPFPPERFPELFELQVALTDSTPWPADAELRERKRWEVLYYAWRLHLLDVRRDAAIANLSRLATTLPDTVDVGMVFPDSLKEVQDLANERLDLLLEAPRFLDVDFQRHRAIPRARSVYDRIQDLLPELLDDREVAITLEEMMRVGAGRVEKYPPLPTSAVAKLDENIRNGLLFLLISDTRSLETLARAQNEGDLDFLYRCKGLIDHTEREYPRFRNRFRHGEAQWGARVQERRRTRDEYRQIALITSLALSAGSLTFPYFHAPRILAWLVDASPLSTTGGRVGLWLASKLGLFLRSNKAANAAGWVLGGAAMATSGGAALDRYLSNRIDWIRKTRAYVASDLFFSCGDYRELESAWGAERVQSVVDFATTFVGVVSYGRVQSILRGGPKAMARYLAKLDRWSELEETAFLGRFRIWIASKGRPTIERSLRETIAENLPKAAASKEAAELVQGARDALARRPTGLFLGNYAWKDEVTGLFAKRLKTRPKFLTLPELWRLLRQTPGDVAGVARYIQSQGHFPFPFTQNLAGAGWKYFWKNQTQERFWTLTLTSLVVKTCVETILRDGDIWEEERLGGLFPQVKRGMVLNITVGVVLQGAVAVLYPVQNMLLRAIPSTWLAYEGSKFVQKRTQPGGEVDLDRAKFEAKFHAGANVIYLPIQDRVVSFFRSRFPVAALGYVGYRMGWYLTSVTVSKAHSLMALYGYEYQRHGNRKRDSFGNPLLNPPGAAKTDPRLATLGS